MRSSSRFLRTALTSALLCVVLSVTVSAASYGTGIVTENSLRLRKDASTGSAILNTVDKGTKVIVLENQKNGWYKVELNGTVGYMSASYLSVTPTPKTYTGKLNTGGSSLNMRSGPGTGYSKVGSIPATATLTITGSENGWYKTSYNGVTGYVSGDYVIVTETTPSTPAAPDPPTETKPETPAPTTSGTGKLNTGGSSLNMRSGPGTSYSKVGSIPANATLTITGKENGWYKTSYNGVAGYVSGDYVIFTAAETPAETTPSTPPAEATPEPPAQTTPGTSNSTNTGSTSTGTANSSTDLGAQVVAYAKKFLGIPYVYGANGPSSYDCSSFTQAVYKKFGYSLNRSAAGQYNNGTAIELSQVQPGDLLIWRAYGSSSTATHVGIYIGNDMYIHASSTGGCITINNMNYGSSVRYLVGVRRIVG